MIIKDISMNEFNDFSKNHILKNMFQSIQYAELMSKYGYEPIYVGGYENNILVAASMLLTKKIAPAFKYGYAPRGFLVDYLNSELLSEFTKKLQGFLYKKNIIFVKINPEIIYSIVNKDNGEKEINYINAKIIDILESLGYIKLKDNLYFEALLPRYNPIISLMEYDFTKLSSTIKNKITKNAKKGLYLVEGTPEDLKTFYSFIKDKKNRPFEYYKDYYEIYNRDDMMDLILIEINNTEYLKAIKSEYEKEVEINNILNVDFQNNPKDEGVYNKKMNSDKKLSDLNVEIGKTSLKIQKNILKDTIAGALVIKYMNRVYILISGFDKNYSKLNPNYLLHAKIIDKYKKENYKFLDLNGITGDFTDDNPYKGLNDFKTSLNPKIYEYIGEFDMVVNKTMYQILLSSNKLQKEFQRKDLKQTEKSN